MTKEEDYINRKISESGKRMKELFDEGDIKKLDDQEKYQISKFYEHKSLNRLQTAKMILERSSMEPKPSPSYHDFSEAVSAAY